MDPFYTTPDKRSILPVLLFSIFVGFTGGYILICVIKYRSSTL